MLCIFGKKSLIIFWMLHVHLEYNVAAQYGYLIQILSAVKEHKYEYA